MATKDNHRSLTVKPSEPVKGSDYNLLKKRSGIQTAAMHWFMGVSPNKWSSITTIKANEMAPRYSLLFRILDRHPELLPRLDAPTPSQLLEKIRLHRPTITEEQFSRILGYQKGAPNRLFSDANNNPSENSRLPTTTRRLMKIISDAIDEDPSNIDVFMGIAEDEARARGQDPTEMWDNGWRVFSEPDKKRSTKGSVKSKRPTTKKPITLDE